MRLKLKEDPKEWLKFTAVLALLGALVTWALFRKNHWPLSSLVVSWSVLLLILAVCACRPRWFRGVYRVGMTVSFRVGQVIGYVMLTLLFLGVLTPLGLLLRLCGKDLLALKRARPGSHWRQPRPWGPLDRQF